MEIPDEISISDEDPIEDLFQALLKFKMESIAFSEKKLVFPFSGITITCEILCRHRGKFFVVKYIMNIINQSNSSFLREENNRIWVLDSITPSYPDAECALRLHHLEIGNFRYVDNCLHTKDEIIPKGKDFPGNTIKKISMEDVD